MQWKTLLAVEFILFVCFAGLLTAIVKKDLYFLMLPHPRLHNRRNNICITYPSACQENESGQHGLPWWCWGCKLNVIITKNDFFAILSMFSVLQNFQGIFFVLFLRTYLPLSFTYFPILANVQTEQVYFPPLELTIFGYMKKNLNFPFIFSVNIKREDREEKASIRVFVTRFIEDLKHLQFLLSSSLPLSMYVSLCADVTGILKLTDFGFAKETLSQQALQTPCYTPYYVGKPWVKHFPCYFFFNFFSCTKVYMGCFYYCYYKRNCDKLRLSANWFYMKKVLNG